MALWRVGSCSRVVSGASRLRVRLAAVRCRSFLMPQRDATGAAYAGKAALGLAAGRRRTSARRNLSPPAAGVAAKHRP